MLPNFLCVGSQKAGTTTLFDLLDQHPQIYLPSCKEVHFFDKDDRYHRGLQWYESEFFSEVRGEKAVGEITPIYMYLDYVPQRIYESLGSDIKLIFMLRNPIDRAYSHYWMSYMRGFEKESFENAIEQEKERIQKGEFERTHFSYVDRGFYAHQIKRYLEYFSKKQMCFIIFENLVKNTPEKLDQIFTFLEVEPYKEIRCGIKRNPASLPRSTFLRDIVYGHSPVGLAGRVLIPSRKIRKTLTQFISRLNAKAIEKPRMRKSTRKRLINLYKDDVKELENLLEIELSFWFSEEAIAK